MEPFTLIHRKKAFHEISSSYKIYSLTESQLSHFPIPQRTADTLLYNVSQNSTSAILSFLV